MSFIYFLQRYYNLYCTFINHLHEYMLLCFITNLHFKCFQKYTSSDFLGGWHHFDSEKGWNKLKECAQFVSYLLMGYMLIGKKW
jgi:hypothetical protein